jgi:hypothetical protein
VNCDPQKRWEVELAGKQHDLSPYGWAAAMSEDFGEWSTVTNGVRQSYVNSPEYLFADGGGVWRDFGEVATDGAIAVRPHEGGREVIVIAPMTRTEVTAAEGATVEALGESREAVGTVAAERAGERLAWGPVERAVSYVVR